MLNSTNSGRNPLNHSLVLPLTLFGFLAAASAGVGAQAIDEIIVTAQKREQSLQDIPISTFSLTGKMRCNSK